MNAKQEALALLKLDTLTYKQAERLNYLTATAAGLKTFYYPEIEFAVFMIDREWANIGYVDEDKQARYLPDYIVSVDACLALPFNHYISMRTLTNYRGESGWQVTLDDFAKTIEVWSILLQIGILTAWWHSQKED